MPFGVVLGVSAPTDSVRAIAFAAIGMGLFLPVSPLITLVQRQKLAAGQLPMVIGTLLSVSYVVSSVAPGVVGPLMAADIPLGTVLTGLSVLGVTPLLGLLLKDAPPPRV